MVIMLKRFMQSAGLTPNIAQVINGNVVSSLTASGSAQNDAAICPAGVNVFTTVAASTGCILGAPTVAATTSRLVSGDSIIVTNHGANDLSVYPPTGGKINNGTANVAITVSTNTSVLFKAISTVDLVTL